MEKLTSSVADAYTRLASSYDACFASAAAYAEDAAVYGWLCRWRCLPSWRGERCRVIDLGCGTGWLLDVMARYGACGGFPMPAPAEATYRGVDISPGMLTIARRKHPGYDWREGDVMRPDAAELGGYDVALAIFGVCSYVAPQMLPAVLTAIALRLRAGGKLAAMLVAPGYRAEDSVLHRRALAEGIRLPPAIPVTAPRLRAAVVATEMLRVVELRPFAPLTQRLLRCLGVSALSASAWRHLYDAELRLASAPESADAAGYHLLIAARHAAAARAREERK